MPVSQLHKPIHIYLFPFFLSSTTLLLQPISLHPHCTHAQSCNPMDCSPPVSSVHGLFQARILEWVAISFSYLFLFFSFFLCFSLSCLSIDDLYLPLALFLWRSLSNSHPKSQVQLLIQRLPRKNFLSCPTLSLPSAFFSLICLFFILAAFLILDPCPTM